MEDLFNAYIVACGGSTSTTERCTGMRVSWDGGPDHVSLLGGADALAAGGYKRQAAADRFETPGDDFGVSNLP
ncbi:hypothetical protein WMF37_42535 [Sorangium sp. So ce291]|uniref:hypothetical protein n=1 Tax=Sorangium sp. So ce291 TaxID=3133294 RepID=UPI003F6023D2